MRPGGTRDHLAARAARLLRWYPKAWRARYGDEFAELPIADIAERPRSAARRLDVARGGTVARLAGVGLCGFGDRDVAASLATLGCSLAVFLVLGVLAALPVLAVVAARIARREGKGLVRPSAVFVAASIETRLAAVACAVMAIFLAGSCCWIATGGGQPSLFHAGTIDVAGAGVLAAALAVARQAARTAGLRIMEY